MTTTTTLTDRIIADAIAYASRAAHTMAEQSQLAAMQMTATQSREYLALCRDIRAGRVAATTIAAAVRRIMTAAR